MRAAIINWSFFLCVLCSFCGKKIGENQNKALNDTILQNSLKALPEDSVNPEPETGLVQSLEIPLIEFENPGYEVDSLLDSCKNQDLRAGFGGSGGITHFYLPNRPGFKYHVISPYGEDLYLAAEIEQAKVEQCYDSIPVWKIKYKPIESAFLPKLKSDRDYHGGLIVVGVKNSINIRPPVRTEVPDSLKSICLAALKPDTFEYSINYFSAGRNNGIERVLIEANGHLDEGFIGVVDTDGKICSVKFKTKDRWNQGRYFDGQADLNGDGLSDVFLVNYGDYGGFEIFTERNGKWIRIHNHGPQPC